MATTSTGVPFRQGARSTTLSIVATGGKLSPFDTSLDFNGRILAYHIGLIGCVSARAAFPQFYFRRASDAKADGGSYGDGQYFVVRGGVVGAAQNFWPLTDAAVNVDAGRPLRGSIRLVRIGPDLIKAQIDMAYAASGVPAFASTTGLFVGATPDGFGLASSDASNTINIASLDVFGTFP